MGQTDFGLVRRGSRDGAGQGDRKPHNNPDARLDAVFGFAQQADGRFTGFMRQLLGRCLGLITVTREHGSQHHLHCFEHTFVTVSGSHDQRAPATSMIAPLT
jgi:hypothetical protein